MRLMERIRRQGQTGLIIFIVIFVISIFAGLGVSGFFNNFSPSRRQDNQQVTAGRQVQLAEEGQYKDAAIVVNGRPVKNEKFNETLNGVYRRASSDSNDPGYQFQAYGEVAMYLIRQELVLSKADELGIKVTSDDLKEKKDEAVMQYMAVDANASSGNVIGDFAKKLGTNRERQKAFEEYLMRSGLTEAQWKAEQTNSIKVRKTIEAVQADIDEDKKVEATATKAKVDEDLEAGMSFEDVVIKYSEGPAAETGGDIGTWVQRGLLFSEEAEDVLFGTPNGEISEWIEIPAGYQRFEIYDKLVAEGPEYEAAKAGIIEGLKTDKGEDYEPSEEEIAEKYEKVKARQLVIKTSEVGAAEQQIADEMQAAKVEINNPIILAYQAIYADRLQPPAGFDQEQLEKFSQNSAIGEDYDYSLLALKLKNGLPKDPSASEEEEEAPKQVSAPEEGGLSGTTVSDFKLEEVTDEQVPIGEITEEGESTLPEEAAPPAAEDAEPAPDMPEAAPDADETEEPVNPVMKADGTTPIPIYALGIGLFKLALQEDDQANAAFLHYMLAKTYLDWLQDEDVYATQPMDRPQARLEIEQSLERVSESYEYSPLVHAYRGLNLAWLDETDKARESLEKAQKYAPRDDQSEAWTVLKDAYEVLDDTAKVAEIDQLINELRQERFQRQIAEAQARQAAQEAAQTPFSPGAGQPEASGEGEAEGDEGSAAEGEAAGGEEASAGEGETAETPEETPAETPAEEPVNE